MSEIHEEYYPEPEDLNSAMTPQEQDDFREFVRCEYGTLPFGYDENGDLIQPDRPMPEEHERSPAAE